MHRKALSAETKRKISSSLISHHSSEECRRKIGTASTGRTHVMSVASRQKQSERQKKLHLEHPERFDSFATVQMMREQGLCVGMSGKRFTDDSKKKMSVSAYHRMSDPAKQRYYDTSIEKLMQLGLSALNVAFETHKRVYGLPDVFIEPNVCVFCDGTFWHADPRKYASDVLMYHNKTAQQIWDKDEHTTNILKAKGYTVLRFWEIDIVSDAQDCAKYICEHIGGYYDAV